MFEIFEEQIKGLGTIFLNIDFIEENYDLIMRSIDRMEIVLNDYYFLSFLEKEDFCERCNENKYIVYRIEELDLGFI